MEKIDKNQWKNIDKNRKMMKIEEKICMTKLCEKIMIFR